MKAFFKEFLRRGLLFAWGGPFVTAIVWLGIHASGQMDSLTVYEAATGIFSSLLLAFIAAGISAVHQAERLPVTIATLIHLLVLYFDYLLVYLLNGWLMPSAVLPFTLIFLAGYAVIWVIVYFATSARVRRMNAAISRKEE